MIERSAAGVPFPWLCETGCWNSIRCRSSAYDSPVAHPNVDPIPVTAATGLAAASVTLGWWYGHDITPLWMWPLWCEADGGNRDFRLASRRCHTPGLQSLLAVVFGKLMETRLGSLKTAGIFILFAAGSSLAEFAFAGTGWGCRGRIRALHDALAPGAEGSSLRESRLPKNGSPVHRVVLPMHRPHLYRRDAGGQLLRPCGRRDHGFGTGGRHSLARCAPLGAIVESVRSWSASWPWLPWTELRQPVPCGAGGLRRLLCLVGESVRGAAELYREAVTGASDDASAWYYMGTALQRLGESRKPSTPVGSRSPLARWPMDR